MPGLTGRPILLPTVRASSSDWLYPRVLSRRGWRGTGTITSPGTGRGPGRSASSRAMSGATALKLEYLRLWTSCRAAPSNRQTALMPSNAGGDEAHASHSLSAPGWAQRAQYGLSSLESDASHGSQRKAPPRPQAAQLGGRTRSTAMRASLETVRAARGASGGFAGRLHPPELGDAPALADLRDVDAPLRVDADPVAGHHRAPARPLVAVPPGEG